MTSDEPTNSLVVGTIRPVQATPPPREIAEKDVLERFWKRVGGQPSPTIVGFNVLSFDLPLLSVWGEFWSGGAA